MVMSKVSLNFGSNAGVQQQSSASDGGFSDVLGGVSSEQKQAGCQGSSQNNEFRYTERAEGRNMQETGGSAVRHEAPEAEAAVVEKAEDMLTAAVSQLRKTLSESGEDMSEYDILKMLLDLIAKKKQEKDGDTDEETVENAMELLMSVLADVSEDIQTEMPVGDAVMTADIASVTEKSGEAAMITGIGTETVQTDEQTAAESAEAGRFETAEIFTAETAEENTAAAAETETAPEAVTSSDENVRMLDDILARAKEELGLTKVTVETFRAPEQTEDTPEAVKPQDIAVKVSSDKVDELNSILSGVKKENNVHTETDNAVHMAAELMGRDEQVETRVIEQPEAPENVQRSPETQTADEILSRLRSMEGDRTEFTMVLNPESLGRITVKLVLTGEKVSVDIAAENPDTKQLLENRAESIQSMLRSSGVELEDYKVVTGEEEAQQLMNDDYDGSSRNPYGRQQQENQSEDDDDTSFYELLQSI